ncbi:hypothetical protein ACS0TY_000673 [Phlomoides rotata]
MILYNTSKNSGEQGTFCKLTLTERSLKSRVECSSEVKGFEMSDRSPLEGKSSDLEHISSKCQASFPLWSNSLDNHNSSEASSSRIGVPPYNHQRHSTLSDPNFVENYFKNSRLHFIGTGRNRYRMRFPNLSNGLKNARSDVNTAAVNEKVVINIDMDCFFVSVVVKDHRELLDKPVAICHSDSSRGMLVKEAKTRSPKLVFVPYDFGAYEMTADQFYDILHKHCNKVLLVWPLKCG